MGLVVQQKAAEDLVELQVAVEHVLVIALTILLEETVATD